MDRLASIKEKVETWEDDMVLNREEAEFLLQRLEIAKNALEKAYGTEGFVYLRDALDQLKE